MPEKRLQQCDRMLAGEKMQNFHLARLPSPCDMLWDDAHEFPDAAVHEIRQLVVVVSGEHPAR